MLEEHIKFRLETGRPLSSAEVDDNFKYVGNPWMPGRSYKPGEMVYKILDVEQPDDSEGNPVDPIPGFFWVRAKMKTTPGVFETAEWDIFGYTSASGSIDTSSIQDVFDTVIVNSTVVGTYSTDDNAYIRATEKDVLQLNSGDGIQLSHDVINNLVNIKTLLNPSYTSESSILTIAGETVDLSALKHGGLWTNNGNTLYPQNAADSIVIGNTTAYAKLDVNGNLRITEVLDDDSSNKVLVQDEANNVIHRRTINTRVWDTDNTISIGKGTKNAIAKWSNTTGSLMDSNITEVGGNVGIGKAIAEEMLDVNGSIKIGTSSNDTIGSIKWDGADFLGNTDGTSNGWVSLTTPTIQDSAIRDIVGVMVSNNVETGINVSYDSDSKYFNFIVDNHTINLTGDLSGSVDIDWTSPNGVYDLAATVNLSDLSIVLGTDTTGEYIQTIDSDKGIAINTLSSSIDGQDVLIETLVDANTITNTFGTNNDKLSVLKVPHTYKLQLGDGLTTDTIKTFDGSADITQLISFKPNTTANGPLVNALDISSEGLAIRIDNDTLVGSASNDLIKVGTIHNSNLEFDYVTINGHETTLGNSVSISMSDLDDVVIPPEGAAINQVLKWTAANKWEPSDDRHFNLSGNANAIQLNGGDDFTSIDSLYVDKDEEILYAGKSIVTEKVKITKGLNTVNAENSVYSFIGESSNDQLTELFVDGISEEIYIEENSVMTFKVRITGVRIGGTNTHGDFGDTWVREFTGAFKHINRNNVTTLSVVGNHVTKTHIANDDTASFWDAEVEADSVNKKLKIVVKGMPDTDITWFATVDVDTMTF